MTEGAKKRRPREIDKKLPGAIIFYIDQMETHGPNCRRKLITDNLKNDRVLEGVKQHKLKKKTAQGQ